MPSEPQPRCDRSSSMLVAKHLQGREKEWTELINRCQPLSLLSLPLDVLQYIIRHITHTNDLTSLALTHSILHGLVVPHIYSRFDIVWPDSGPATESRVGVDALTYGLGTLVMAQDVFGETASHNQLAKCEKCGHPNFCQHRPPPSRPRKTRRGNYFAQYTRKFSLGNGPEDWVKEYLITKEGGKMLGTLVALAVGRMRSLESFTWDMPTGVLRDVWLALASLGDRDDGQPCRLERVWVRWHDNQDTWIPSPVPIGTAIAVSHSSLIPRLVSNGNAASFRIPSYPTVQFPTLSVLPPLKSLSVLDIDEVSYVEEMSVLIDCSLGIIRELRLGLAHHAQGLAWARPKEDRSLLPPTPAATNEQRAGGLLGIIVSRFCTAIDEPSIHEQQFESTHPRVDVTDHDGNDTKQSDQEKTDDHHFEPNQNDLTQLGNLFSAQTLADVLEPELHSPTNTPDTNTDDAVSRTPLHKQQSERPSQSTRIEQRRLQLEILELERVSLSVPVLSQAFDWSRLRTLTILGCRNHESLWKVLRKQFTPPTRMRASSISKQLTSSNESFFGRRSTSMPQPCTSDSEYQLNITRLHTDAVSATLLAFMRDSLAPDTLEYLFLQQSPIYKSPVTIDQIYKHAVRRHRGSLQKLLIDSDVRTVDASPDSNTNWRKWAVNRDLIACITSGRMKLRELSISIEYKHWHYFLQRLANAQQLRSLHVTRIADYINGRLDPKEAALQVLDIVALRPELELCYLGIQGKCFEILEYTSNRKTSSTTQEQDRFISSTQMGEESDSEENDEREGDDVPGDDESDYVDLETDQDDADDSEDETQRSQERTALRLREILFYDDKISIFKARHGKL